MLEADRERRVRDILVSSLAKLTEIKVARLIALPGGQKAYYAISHI